MQVGQPLVAGGLGLAVQPGQQVGAPLGKVHDPRGHAVRVQAQPQHVDRRLEQFWSTWLVNSAMPGFASTSSHQRFTTTAG